MTETNTKTDVQVVAERLGEYVAALNVSSSDHHKFSVVKGRRYYKVIDSRPTDGGPLAGGSVHAFIEITTGHVFKPAGHAKPAPHVRFYLLRDGSYQALLHHAHRPDAYSGGYLYIR
jgi:hypothetical protein